MKKFNLVGLIFSVVFLLFTIVGCSSDNEDQAKNDNNQKQDTNDVVQAEETQSTIFAPHKDVNQEPVPLKMERNGSDVYIEMTSQITDIPITKDFIYKAWTFNGEAPGPVVVVNEGDTIHFTLKNIDPAIPHSMDFHAVHAAPNKDFADVMPNEEGTFVYQASKPGVFMYHCGTKPVLAHIANGMHGTIIVKPTDGYPTDDEIDREYVIIQNEWYKYNDMDDMTNGVPSQVVFSTKALKEGQPNTNGTTTSLVDSPVTAKVGDKVRFYVNNVGPNEVSSFHVVGTIFDDVYIDGNPYNHMMGMQTVLLPASGGAVVEFTVKKAGNYPIVTHQFNHAQKGAVGILKVTEDGQDDGEAVSGH
ncbi:multicopper oxidase domain-containing protein [Bacillaceae bacterium S4-13-58]